MLKYVGPEGGQLKANLTSTGANIMVTQVSYGAFISLAFVIKKMAQPRLFFTYFSLLVQKILVVSRIGTRTIEVEGKDIVH